MNELLELLKAAQVRLFMLGGSETDEYQAIREYLEKLERKAGSE